MMPAQAPAGPSSTINVGEAFGYVFRSPGWVSKILIGALCVLFFWVILIPVFILNGYFVETARSIARGGTVLPEWTDVGKKLREGFVLAVVLLIWGLPGSLLEGGGSYSCAANNVCSYHPGSLSGLGYLYSLLIGLLTPAIWSQFLNGGFGAGFDFRAIFRRAGQNPGMTVIVWLMAIVAGIIGVAGTCAIIIGLLVTIPYAGAVVAHLYGQFSRNTDSSAAMAT
jgi:hypothetical protein